MKGSEPLPAGRGQGSRQWHLAGAGGVGVRYGATAPAGSRVRIGARRADGSEQLQKNVGRELGPGIPTRTSAIKSKNWAGRGPARRSGRASTGPTRSSGLGLLSSLATRVPGTE